MTRPCLAVALTAALPLLGTAALDGEPPGPPAADTATDAVRAFRDALRRGDRTAALAVLAPDLQVFESGDAQASRDEYAAEHLAADMEFAAATTSAVVEQRSGGDESVAWVLSRIDTKGTFRGKDAASRGLETAVLRKTPDGWRIVHLHWSSRRNVTE